MSLLDWEPYARAEFALNHPGEAITADTATICHDCWTAPAITGGKAMPRSKEEVAALTDELVRAYTAGMSLKQIERRYDVSASFAGRLLKRAGVQMRPSADTTTVRHAWGRMGLSAEQTREYRQRLAGAKW